jgi:hypothetical protein
MKTDDWARLLAYVTGLINQQVLLRNEYLAAENRILRAQLPKRLRLTDPQRCTLAEQHHGFQPKTCWIAHCKELQGVPLRKAANRRGKERLDPCPPDKRTAIIQAFRRFGMLP